MVLDTKPGKALRGACTRSVPVCPLQPAVSLTKLFPSSLTLLQIKLERLYEKIFRDSQIFAIKD